MESVSEFLARGGKVIQCKPQAIPKLLMTVEGTATRAKPKSNKPKSLKKGR